MGILGTFLGLGWLGGNLFKDYTRKSKIDDYYNNCVREPEDRIYMRNGKYYDRVTGKQVICFYIKDEEIGGTAKVWAAVGCYAPGVYVYNETRDRWERENEEWKEKIESAQKENNEKWLKEAEEQGRRFAKCILPYRPGIRKVCEGYIDRMYTGNLELYYMAAYDGMKKTVRTAEFKSGRWIDIGGFATDPFFHIVSAGIDDEYDDPEEIKEFMDGIMKRNKEKENAWKKSCERRRNEKKK